MPHIITQIQEILNSQRQLVKNHKGMQERKPVDMETIIYDCRSMLFAAIDKKGIQVKINIQGYSGTAIPTYQTSFAGTGKKITKEAMNKSMININRSIVKNLFYIRD